MTTPVTWRCWGLKQPPKDAKVLNLTDPRLSEDATTATVRMYGPIDSWGGFWGVSAEEVSAALDALPATVTTIQLRINSPGGEAWEALTILNMLRAHSARIVGVVDGLAASCASFIAAGCDETVMSPGSQMMIHDAWGVAVGNPAEMRKSAEFLDSVSDSIAELYAEAAGGTRAKWRGLMTAETWYTAGEAAAAKLADRVGVVPDLGVTSTVGADDQPEPDPFEIDPFDRFDLSLFDYAGRDQAPAPRDEAPTDPDTTESADEAAEETDSPESAAATAETTDTPDLSAEERTALARAIDVAAQLATCS